MKKIIALSLVFLITVSFCSCSFGGEKTESPTMYEPTLKNTTETTATTSDESSTESTTSAKPTSTTQKSSETETTVKNSEEEGESKVVTYYSENPNNRYIKAVVNKYGVDASCLVALIRTNSSVPGATVLQFTGEKDAKGNLIKTESTLKYVYDVSDNGTIKKASGQKTDNDGYKYVESYVNYNLAVKYLIPQLDDMKKQRTYEDYFND